MIIKARNIYSIDPEYSCGSYSGDMSIELDVSHMNIDDLIDYAGEDTLLDEIDDNVIMDYVKSERLHSNLNIDEMSFDVGEMLEHVFNNIGESGVLDMISDEAIRARHRDIVIDELDE